MPNAEDIAWRCLVDAKATIAEKPYYVPAQNAIYWIDVYGQSLHRTTLPDAETHTWALPDRPGSFALDRGAATALVAMGDAVHWLDLASGRTELAAAAGFDTTRHRFNDGRCDPAGRFWVGTIIADPDVPKGSGHFYRHDVDAGTLAPSIDDITHANGIAFSPDGSCMYLADRINGRILAFDYDVASGTADNRRVFATLGEGDVADGGSVDEDGGYWVAIFDKDEIRRYTPDGTVDRVVRSPVPRPTMCAFGGPGLDLLILTTGRYHLDDATLAANPTAGGVFLADVGARGVPEVPVRTTVDATP